MKKIILFLIAGTFSLPALSQSATESGTVTISAGQAISLPVQVYKTSTDERREVKGQYDLANGKTLTVSNFGRRIYAEIDGLPQAEMLAVSPVVYVAKNRQMKLSFDRTGNHVYAGVVVTYVVRTPVAAGNQPEERLETIASLR